MSKMESNFLWNIETKSVDNNLLTPIKQDITNLQNKDNELTNSLNTKQDKLVVGPGLNLNGNNLTLTNTPITLDQVKQEIAKAELDDITLNEVETNLIAPINTQIQELQNKDVQLQNSLNSKVDNDTFNNFKTSTNSTIEHLNNNKLNSSEFLNVKNELTNSINTKQDNLINSNDIVVNPNNSLTFNNNYSILFKSIFLNGDTYISQFDDLRYITFQIDVSNHREQGYIWKNEIPQEIKNINNIQYVESIEYCLLQSNINKYKVFSSNLANIAAYVVNDQLVLRNESGIPSYISHIRVKILLNLQN